jgi:hypothetical protein
VGCFFSLIVACYDSKRLHLVTMPANRQPELWAAALIPYTAATIALVLRLVARRKTRMLLRWEDYLAVVAFVSGLCTGTRLFADDDAVDRKWLHLH